MSNSKKTRVIIWLSLLVFFPVLTVVLWILFPVVMAIIYVSALIWMARSIYAAPVIDDGYLENILPDIEGID